MSSLTPQQNIKRFEKEYLAKIEKEYLATKKQLKKFLPIDTDNDQQMLEITKKLWIIKGVLDSENNPKNNKKYKEFFANLSTAEENFMEVLQVLQHRKKILGSSRPVKPVKRPLVTEMEQKSKQLKNKKNPPPIPKRDEILISKLMRGAKAPIVPPRPYPRPK